MVKKIRKFNNGGAVNLPDDIVDPDEVFLDDDGNPMSPDDPEFQLGNPEPDDPKKTNAPNPPVPSAQEPTDEGEDGNGDEGSDEGEEEPANYADYVLRSLGLEARQIDLGDGNIKDVADLTEEEQLQVITGRMEEVVQFYESQLEEASTVGAFSNDVERLIVETLRSNEYNLSDLVKVITENDPAAQARTASNEDLVRNHLKSIYPNFSDEDINEELEAMSGTSRFDRLASTLRENMQGKTLGEGDLAKAIASYRDKMLQQQSEAFEQDRQGVVSFINELKEFNKIPLNDEVKQSILQEIVSEDPAKDSPFIESINNPERLFKLSFLDKYHDQIVENTAKYYFELGKKEAEKIVGKFKETPDVISVGTKFKRSNAGASASKKSGEEEF